MKLDRQKYELARARDCMGQKDLVAAGIPKRTLEHQWNATAEKTKQQQTETELRIS